MADLIAALAENLEIHMQSLDLTDPKAQEEHEAYAHLAVQSRGIARHLKATAQEMAGYRDLPMGRHDDDAMSDPQAVEAFEKLVRREEALDALLSQSLERDQKMLAEESLDVTLPWQRRPRGARHPITQIAERIVDETPD